MAVKAFDFSHYFKYDELVSFLHEMAEAYPQLIRLETIGQSYEGRKLWVATLTNRQTGPALEKPGYWIDANTHAGEVVGSVVALYSIHHLLTKYGEDAQVTRLLDNYTVYILPRITVDGTEKYLTTPYRLRSSVRHYPFEEARDGLYEEDVNGDGLVLQMRIKDENGAWKVSEKDPRIMLRREPEEFGGEYYSLLPEGLIRNYNGYDIKAVTVQEGMDFNRNYPFEWAPEGTQRGSGEFPYSEPETRAEAEYWRTHRNINGFLTYHTHAGVILRPYSTHPDDYFPVEDLDIYKLIGDKGTEITGYRCVSTYHDFRYHPKELTYGAMDDHSYDHFGWFGFTTELWDVPSAAGVDKKDFIKWYAWHPEEDDLKIMAWNDEKLDGQGFKSWQPFEHPQLGPVEIGGWDFKFIWQNAPVEFLPELAEKHCRFTIAHALMSPRLALARTEVKAQGGDNYRVVVQLQNQGFLPTYTSKKALERGVVRPVAVKLNLPEGVELVSGEKEQEIGQLEGRSSKAFFGEPSLTDDRRKLEWVIKGPAGSEVQLEARSERAGTIRTSITLA
ncbi:MAG TPA: M14 family metallopeptidase [Chloroflexia bacterium]|nr:M14 family metallopeptidase [Chloroflexia bacterium]